MTTITAPAFDVTTLREYLVRTFGEFGAHVEVFDDLLHRLREYERRDAAVPTLAADAIGILSAEIEQAIVRSGSSMVDKEERKHITRDIKRKLAAVSVLSNMRGEVVRVGNQWRIKSERSDQYYIVLFDLPSDMGACNCQAGATGQMCKHQEAARVLELARVKGGK